MKQEVRNLEIAFILFSAMSGYNVMDMPKQVAEKAGTASWISILISALIMTVFLYMFLYLGRMFPNMTIYEYSEILVGKKISRVIVMIYIAFFFISVVLITRLAMELVKNSLLIRTPIWALFIPFLVILYMAASRGMWVVIKFMEFYGIAIITFAIFIQILLFTEGEIINIRPLLGDRNIVKYLSGVPKAITSLVGIELLVVIPFSESNNKSVMKYGLSMLWIIAFIYILTVESCIAVLGVDKLSEHKDALLATARRVDIMYLEFLRRIDGVVLVAWLMTVYTTMLLYLYGTISLLQKILKREKLNIITLIVCITIFVLALIPSNIKDVEKILNYTSYLILLTVMIIPMLLFIVAKIKMKNSV